MELDYPDYFQRIFNPNHVGKKRKLPNIEESTEKKKCLEKTKKDGVNENILLK